MGLRLANLLRQAERLRADAGRSSRFDQYRSDPERYCRDILRVRLTPAQQEIARLVVTPPYKVLVPAGHNVGKSFLAACLVNWRFDCFNPGITLTTAPTERQVRDILWKEVRTLRRGRGCFPGPKVCRLESSPGHFAHGFTARDGDRFQGHHSPSVFIVFDEAEGVDPIFWEAAETMLGGDYALLAIYNPTAQSSPAADAERSGRYHLCRMSAVQHPNIAAELAGQLPPFPSAIRLGRLLDMLAEWSDEVDPRQKEPGDVTLAGRCFRTGPVAQARLLGIRPTTAFNAVWSESVFDATATRQLPTTGPLQIGCDVARFGDDFTCLHVRVGGVSVHHESANGWSVVRTSQRCQELAHEWGTRRGLDPRRVVIAIDVCGVGGGVVDVLAANGWTAVGVDAAGEAPDPEEFPNLRSALWFGMAAEAARGNVSFAQLPARVRAELRRQLLAPTYHLDVRGRRVVENKEDTKERIKRSPDDADAVLLAYANVRATPERVAGRLPVP